MKKLVLSIYLFAIIFSLHAQSTVYLGVESGLTNDRFEFFDDGGFMVSVPRNAARVGGIIGYTHNNLFSVETGFFIKDYTEGFGFEVPQFHSSSTASSIRTWQIPIRIKTRVKLISDKLYFVPSIGYHHCINRDHLFRGERGSLSHNNFVNYHYSVDYTQYRTFPLLETGLGIEMNAFKWARVNFTASYFTGFKDVVTLDMTYNVFDGEDIMVRGLSKGEYLNLSLGLSFPIFQSKLQ